MKLVNKVSPVKYCWCIIMRTVNWYLLEIHPAMGFQVKGTLLKLSVKHYKLSSVWNKIHPFLYGRRFTLITDKPLLAIFNYTSAIPTLAAARMQKRALTAHDYGIEYKRFEDALSRLRQCECNWWFSYHCRRYKKDNPCRFLSQGYNDYFLESCTLIDCHSKWRWAYELYNYWTDY